MKVVDGLTVDDAVNVMQVIRDLLGFCVRVALHCWAYAALMSLRTCPCSTLLSFALEKLIAGVQYRAPQVHAV